MESYVSRLQVRAINRKLFANDIVYNDDNRETLTTLISNIIQKYNPEDDVAGVPTILEIKHDCLDLDIINSIQLLDTASIIVEVNSRVFAEPDKVSVVRQLKENGYKILVKINKEDTVFSLAKILADYIKIDIKGIPEEIMNGRNKFTCKKIACNVNTDSDYVIASAANIDYYEGTYISPEDNVEIKTNEHSQVNFIEIIRLINEENSDIKDMAKVISRDSLMSAQIIRLSNSVYFASRTRIQSIDDAIIRVGINNLKRWVFLLQFTDNKNVPEELLQTSYHRAVFCERIVNETKISGIKASDAYMIGLFSTLDILTGRPMDTELSKMHLSEVVEDALIYRDGVGGQLLNLVRAYEEANWEKLNKFIQPFKISNDKIFNIYFESLDEVANLWRSLTELGGLHQ